MRKSGRLTFLVVPLLVLAGCGSEEPSSIQDLLWLRTPSGVAVVGTGATSPNLRARATPAGDWSSIVRADSNGSSTRVEALNPLSGTGLWGLTLPGNLEVKVVSQGGNVVALGPAGEGYYFVGRRGQARIARSHTKLVIVKRNEARPRTIRLKGNYEPEAFSTDGNALFVLKYSPARAPTRYQVRRLNLRTGRVGGVYTVDGDLQESMRGTARVQAMSPDGNRLYTLYTLGRGDSRRAFIHVLSLDEKWAHCIDLPEQFGTAGESSTVLTVAPDGTRLYVADASTWAVAEVDTAALAVKQTSTIDFGEGSPAFAALSEDDTLFLASDKSVVAVDAASLGERRSWEMRGRITGIQVGSDGTHLYVGGTRKVAVLDTVTGERVGMLDPPGVRWIQGLGRVMRSLDEERTTITCAC
jgi:DNA-binding beta-propeller fold protein YncE